ncbi:MAG: hypothetical protein EAX81_03315 [Candidatus Thorarchaeota archaeon]|nr:hypothetical protein [Candidatus Thorarchaeota archaeon]
MGRKIQEFRPNVVLADAIYAGLSALVRLASKRKNAKTYRFYQQISKNWKIARKEWKSSKAKGSHDFSSVQGIEPVLRRLYLKMLWYSTARYGNKEFKRVYSWREGTVGPLNALLNSAGSTLRDLLVTRYPFPNPQLYEIRQFSDGRTKVIPKRVADELSTLEDAKVHLKAGYPGNSKKPRILLTHPTLPALDFGDMIRAHLVELCRQCFIHGVPRKESQRYIRLLTHRLIPFLDWIYTGGRIGRKNFYPDADQELRRLVLEIRTRFSQRIGSAKRISEQIEGPTENPGVDFLMGKAKAEMEKDDSTGKRGQVILAHIENDIVGDADISNFIEEVSKKTQREGNDWHRVLLSGFSHPSSLKAAVFAGDDLLQEPSGMQYLAEVPVTGPQGAGRIDLVLFVRNKKAANQYIWTPIMILEVKTKAGFRFNLYGRKPRTKESNVYAPEFYSWKESLTEAEWKAMLDSIPPHSHLGQLDAYEQSILAEYNALAGDVLELKTLWKGVVTLDISQDYEITKKVFDQLVSQLADSLVMGEFYEKWATLTFENTDSSKAVPRIAITMVPAKGPKHILKKIVPSESIRFENPFDE